MKCIIRHESRGRLRVHLCCARMTLRHLRFLHIGQDVVRPEPRDRRRREAGERCHSTKGKGDGDAMRAERRRRMDQSEAI